MKKLTDVCCAAWQTEAEMGKGMVCFLQVGQFDCQTRKEGRTVNWVKSKLSNLRSQQNRPPLQREWRPNAQSTIQWQPKHKSCHEYYNAINIFRLSSVLTKFPLLVAFIRGSQCAQ